MRVDRTDPLEAFIDESLRQFASRHYYPKEFNRMRAQYGTVSTIEKLVKSGEIQSGFRRLQQLHLLERSMEAAVLQFPNEFTRDAIQCA
jgi:hypothetical protein